MAKLKGYKKLNKNISKIFKEFGVSDIKGGDDYAYYFDRQKITFRITITEADALFTQFVKERFDYEDNYPFILSILHEIGHGITAEDVDGFVYDWCQQEKDRIEQEIKTATGDRWNELQYEYFNLPDEIGATAWAVDYAKAHPKKVRKMWEKCEKALHEFYAKNLG